MKKYSKKAICVVLVVALIATFTFSFTACNNKPIVQTDTETVITITKAYYEEGDTLKSYMDKLVEKNQLSYTMESSGMLAIVNGREAKASNGEYWFLYTSDEEYSNKNWGIYVYNEKEFASAIFGISDLPIKLDEIYILAISKF